MTTTAQAEFFPRIIVRLSLAQISALLLLAFLTGCATPSKRQELSQRAAEDALLQVDRDFARLAAAQGEGKAFYAYAADDAWIMPAGSHPLKGREAIRQAMSGDPQGGLSWAPTHAELSPDGQLGYTWGYYQFKLRDSAGQTKVQHGKYVTVWRHQPNGWRFIMDIGNAAPAPK